MIKEDDLVFVLERRCHKTPEPLVAAKTVCEHHGLRALAKNLNIIPVKNILGHLILLA